MAGKTKDSKYRINLSFVLDRKNEEEAKVIKLHEMLSPRFINDKFKPIFLNRMNKIRESLSDKNEVLVESVPDDLSEANSSLEN